MLTNDFSYILLSAIFCATTAFITTVVVLYKLFKMVHAALVKTKEETVNYTISK